MSRVLDQAEWQSWVCDDLDSVLKLLHELYGSRVSRVHVDMKAARAEVYLAGEVPAEAFGALSREFSSNPSLRFVGGSAVCLEHYCSIELFERAEAESPVRAEGSVWANLKGIIGKVFGGRR